MASGSGGDATSGAAPPSAQALLQDRAFLEDLRRQMIKFASQQFGDSQLAEDAVQEALIGALRNAPSFGGRSALRTWVFAILKNKIADSLRQRKRLVEASRLLDEGDGEDDSSEWFDERGSWNADDRPARWGDPESAMQDTQFWRVFEACLEHLPGKQARIFMMREFIELDSREICDAAGITVTNLNVMLHRARIRLRACLEENWFSGKGARC